MADEREAKAEDLLDGSDTQNIESDSKTSLSGEEIPEAFEVKGADIEEGLVAEDEPISEPEPQAPAEPDLNPMEKMFQEKGLDKQFSSVEDMMSRVPEMNKYINDLGVKNKELEKLKEQAPPAVEPVKAPSADDFYNDPVTVIKDMVDKRQDEFNQRFDAMEANAFINSKSDYASMEPLMEAQLQENPGLQTLGIKALPILYQMAKGKQLSSVQAAPAPVPNKASATASVGKKAAPIDKTDPSYWHGKTTKEIEAELGMSAQYKD